MLSKGLFFLVFVSAISRASGQTGLTVGYHYGYANPREINRVLHAYNLRNETILTDKMPAIHGFKGLSVGFQVKGFRNSGMEFMWVGRSAMVSAKGSGGAGGIVQRDIKVISNSFNIGQFYTWNNNKMMWGYSFDFGMRLKGYTRKAPTAEISGTKWEDIFNVESNPLQFLLNVIPTGFTLYQQSNIGPVGIRVWYQMQGMPQTLGNLDMVLLGTSLRTGDKNYPLPLHDKFSNIGISVNILLGVRRK